MVKYIPEEDRTPYKLFILARFRQNDTFHHQRTPALLRLAEEYATHLTRMEEHTSTLSRYNIAIDRDGGNMEHVKSIANRCGLQVPY